MSSAEQLEQEIATIQGALKRLLASYILPGKSPLRKDIRALLSDCIIAANIVRRLKDKADIGVLYGACGSAPSEAPHKGLDDEARTTMIVATIRDKYVSISNRYKTRLAGVYLASIGAVLAATYPVLSNKISLGWLPEGALSMEKDSIQLLIRLLCASLVGSALYFVSDKLAKFEANLANDDATVDRAKFNYAKFFLAVLIPIALFLLVTVENSKTVTMASTPVLLCFACGYSYTVTTTLLNRIVDRATKMVQAI